MGRNVFFNHAVKSEQFLYEDLIIEAMEIHGLDVYYIPRTITRLDNILNEDIASVFGDAYMITMYLEDLTDGYGGEQTIMSKFGLEIRDTSNWVVAKRTWENFVGVQNNTIVAGRPNEGDLIYIPLTGSFHEIKFVEHESPFYQLGNIFVYKLQCETFEYSNEKFDTGISEIDTIEDTYAFSQRMLVSDGNGIQFQAEEDVRQLVGYNEDGSIIYVYGNIGEVDYISSISANVMVNQIRSTSDAVRYFIPTGLSTLQRLEGLTSGAIWGVASVEDSKVLPNDPDADNMAFETEGNIILDFSETNPFGEPGGAFTTFSEMNTYITPTMDSLEVTMDSTAFTFDQQV
jgi:hypothetical protein